MSIYSKLFDRVHNNILSGSELKKLQSYPRFTPVETVVFGNKLQANDACTLINDIRSLIYKEVYRFSTKDTEPIIIDCGANIGISLIFFKKLYDQARVIALEPDPVLFDCLKRNVASFNLNNITLLQKAVWIDNKGISFQIEGGHSGQIVENKTQGDQVINVPSIRLRDLLKSYERINMLKMDIEGAENKVIFDCGDMLNRCDHVFVEYHSKNENEQKLHRILELFSNFGFRYHVQPAFTRKRPFIDNNLMVGMDLQLNLFFYRQ